MIQIHSSSGTGGEPGPCEVTKSHVLSAVFFPKSIYDAGFSFSLFRREDGRTGHRAKWLRESFAGRDRAK